MKLKQFLRTLLACVVILLAQPCNKVSASLFNPAAPQPVQSFSDVVPGSAYYSAVESLKNLGVVKGYSDGTFRPQQAVNRAEALKMVLLSAKQDVSPGLYQTNFPDVKLSDWFSGYIFKGQSLNIVNGNPDGTFAPSRQVNKAEFLKMAEQSFMIDILSYKNVQFALSKDIVNVSDWYVPYFNYAKSVGIVLPNIENKLEPGKFLTRGDCAEILYKMYIVENGGEVQELLSAAESKLVDAIIRMKENNLNDALTRAQEAVFYTGTALQKEPNSNVTQGADLIANGFKELFEASGALLQKDSGTAKTLAEQAKMNADAAVAKYSDLSSLAQTLKTVAEKIASQA